mmetsp:Transcript_97660/g.232462  ORF Transcript_97660/g.232462 Transcript_97660/m.232462 type:complete len:625 (+) Transcript_97660:82-1956(+)
MDFKQSQQDHFWSRAGPDISDADMAGKAGKETVSMEPSHFLPNLPGVPDIRKDASMRSSPQSEDDEEEMAMVTENLAQTSFLNDRMQKRRQNLFPDAEDMKQKIRKSLVRPAYDVTNFYHDHGCFQSIARSRVFDNTTLLIITVNALWISYDTDRNKANTLLDAELQFLVMENFFCLYFVCEWIVRFGAFRRKCDCVKDYWFVFDSFLMLLMIGETWALPLALVASGTGAATFTEDSSHLLDVLKVCRLLRLARMARMLRSISELMILIKGMAAAGRSVFFVMCLLVIIVYIFSIAFTQLAQGTVMGSVYFPTVQHAMYSLLIYGTFLDDIAPFCDAVGAESIACLTLVFIFSILSACTVLNLLIGVLCEVVSQVAQNEKEDLMVQKVTMNLQILLQSLDVNNDGRISQAEFVQIMELPEAVLALEEVGIDPVSIVDFTEYIFGGEDNSEDALNFSNFMEVILKLRQTNECTIRDMVDLRRHISSQLTMAQDVVLDHLREHGERQAKRRHASPTSPQHNSGVNKDFHLFTSSDASGTAGTGSTIDRQPVPSLHALQARTAKLEHMMKEALAEVDRLLHEPSKPSPSDQEALPRITKVKARQPPELPRAQVIPKPRGRPNSHRPF